VQQLLRFQLQQLRHPLQVWHSIRITSLAGKHQLAKSRNSSSSSSWNPADLVAAKLSEAAAAASAATLQPLASAAGSLYAGSINLVSSVTSTVTSSVTASVTSYALGPAADQVVRDAIAGITSAEIAQQPPKQHRGQRRPPHLLAASARLSGLWQMTRPVNIRYFVIQGSDSLDHWKTNLMFEPVLFEGPDMGVRVHRGAYEAACALYERFLPLVQEHVDKDPVARVCFTVSFSSQGVG